MYENQRREFYVLIIYVDRIHDHKEFLLGDDLAGGLWTYPLFLAVFLDKKQLIAGNYFLPKSFTQR